MEVNLIAGSLTHLIARHEASLNQLQITTMGSRQTSMIVNEGHARILTRIPAQLTLPDSINPHDGELGKNVGMNSSTPYPVFSRDGVVGVNGRRSEWIHRAELMWYWAKSPSWPLRYAQLRQGTLRVGLMEALCNFILRGGVVGCRVEAVADPAQGRAGFVVGGLQE